MLFLFNKLLDIIVYSIPCHRLESRCLKINGKPMRVCARCFSILLGYLCIPFLLFFNIPIYVGILFQIPMLLDGFTQMYKVRTSNNYLRVITGLISGFGLSVCIVACAKFILRMI